MADFYSVSVLLPHAKAIAWDTCHKIYVLMDDEQVVKMREYGYGDENDPDSLITSKQMNKQEMLDTIVKWYNSSCSLRFINAVSSVPEGTDPNEGYEVLIGQFEDDPDDDE